MLSKDALFQMAHMLTAQSMILKMKLMNSLLQFTTQQQFQTASQESKFL